MFEVFANIGYVILLVNCIIFFMGFSQHGNAHKIFSLYLGLIMIIQIVTKVLKYLSIHNLFLSHFYFIGQFILLSFFYLVILKGDYQKRTVKMGLLLCLLVLGVQYSYDTSLFLKFNLFEIFITSILLITYSAFHFYNMLDGKKKFYYINIGILTYLFSSAILFLVGNLTIELSPGLRKTTWILNAFLYIVYQVLILIEWKNSYYKKKIE